MATRKVRARTSASSSPGKRRVLVEIRAGAGAGMSFAQGLGIRGFALDDAYEPVPLDGAGKQAMAVGETTYVVRGEIEEGAVASLEARPEVVGVWTDAEIAPFGMGADDAPSDAAMAPADCPIPPCDCASNVPKGAIADVASYLKVDQVWAQGFNGTGITIGIVDGGITAQGRPTSGADTGAGGWPNKLVSGVTGGWPAADWGTTGVAWGWHGNMTATDARGMAPGAQIYDMRISDAGSATGVVSNALSAYQWAIDTFKATGKPQVLSNSWGMWQKNWAADYATNPNHPFTKKVVEAIDAGMIVLFAAGNCGKTCGGSKCGSDKGPGKSIWGANGHPRVMTVGAVNKNEQFIGYSSQGPAALDPKKPDFCGISHFTGFFNSDSGTSAACPVVAGVAALLKQGKPAATHDQIKRCLQSTSKDIGPAGWDPHSGYGIVQGKAAFDCVRRPVATIAYLDRLTIAWRDRITISILDRITAPSRDRLTSPYLDRITTSILDQGGTNKRIDDVKTHRLDKNPITDRIRNPIRERILPIRGFGATPFVLSTPHHAAGAGALEEAFGGAEEIEAAIDEHGAALTELAEAMAELEAAAEEAANRATEADAELAEISAAYDTVVAQYQELAAMLAQLTGSSQEPGST